MNNILQTETAGLYALETAPKLKDYFEALDRYEGRLYYFNQGVGHHPGDPPKYVVDVERSLAISKMNTELLEELGK